MERGGHLPSFPRTLMGMPILKHAKSTRLSQGRWGGGWCGGDDGGGRELLYLWPQRKRRRIRWQRRSGSLECVPFPLRGHVLCLSSLIPHLASKPLHDANPSTILKRLEKALSSQINWLTPTHCNLIPILSDQQIPVQILWIQTHPSTWIHIPYGISITNRKNIIGTDQKRKLFEK